METTVYCPSRTLGCPTWTRSCVSFALLAKGPILHTVTNKSLQTFYLDYRRAITHPSCNTAVIDEEKIPKDIDGWNKLKSRKLSTITTICSYHLAQDNRRPLEVGARSKLLESHDFPVSEVPTEDSRGGTVGPDKIIIFSFFASNIVFIGKVSVHLSHLIMYDDPRTRRFCRSWVCNTCPSTAIIPPRSAKKHSNTSERLDGTIQGFSLFPLSELRA